MFAVILAIASIALAVASYLMRPKQQEQSQPEDLGDPTADDSIPFGQISGLTRCKVNTIYFKHTGSRAVRTKSGK